MTVRTATGPKAWGGRWILTFALLAFAFWGVRPLWEPDEGRYGEAAREMLVQGDPLSPRLHGEPHLTKPPMTYWLIAAGLWVTGTSAESPTGSAWGARLPLAFAFFVTMLAVVALGEAWGWRREEALASGLVFGTALLPFACGHILTTDMFLTCLETVGILCLWKVWTAEYDDRVTGVWRRGFWLAFGLAFLVKGPPGWLPLWGAVVFLWLSPVFRPRCRVWSPGGLGVMLVVAAAWFVLMVVLDPKLLTYFVQDEVVGRVLSEDHGRGKPWHFYLWVVPLGTVPWLFFWGGLLRGMKRVAGRVWQAGGGVRERLGAMTDAQRFSLCWFMAPFVVFQLAGSKMYLYMTPLMVPLALWLGREWLRRWPGWLPEVWRPRRVAIGVAGVWVGVMLTFVLLPDRLPYDRTYRALAKEVGELEPAPEVLYLYEEGAVDSISFNSGVLQVRPAYLSKGKWVDALAMLAGWGEVVYMLSSEDGVERLEEDGIAYQVAARQKDLVVLRVIGQARGAR